MSDKDTVQLKKQELITILKESLAYLENVSDKEIEKRETKMNTDNGTGYLISNEQFHMWIVKIDK